MKREETVFKNLKLRVVKHFGRNIKTAKDCEDLAERITDKVKLAISAQTLRRFFSLINSTSNPSIYTLNILSIYVGYKDFEHFSHSSDTEDLEKFFNENQRDTFNYWKKSEELCKQISESAEMLVSTHQRLMAYPMARKYFMENHPMRDMIATVYSQYFLTYLKYNHTNEAKIFAYGFLFQSAFLENNVELMTLYYQQVKETEITEDVYVIPAGLKFGVELLYEDYIGNEELFAETYKDMKSARLNLISESEKSVCSFEYSVLEFLIFTNRHSEIKFLVENNTKQKKYDYTYIPESRKKTHDEVWYILCAVSYFKLGNLEKSKIYADKVDLSNLGVGWEKYYSLIYYSVLLKLNDGADREYFINQINNLVSETHFSYFKQLSLSAV